MIMHSYSANSKVIMREKTNLNQRQPELIYCTKCTYKLMIRGVGSYATDSLIHMWWVIFCHRMHHFVNGEGFRD